MNPKPRTAHEAPAIGRKQIAWFPIKCLAIYGLLIVPWPGWMDAYASYLRGMGNLMYGTWGPRGKVEFRAAPPGKGDWDTVIIQTNLERGMSGSGYQDSRKMGYLPTAALVALVLATPVPRVRRIRALCWGLALVNAFLALKLFIHVLYDFCGDQPFALYVMDTFWRAVMKQVMLVVLFAPAGYFLFPTIIWLLVTFRRSEWNSLFGGVGRES